MTVTQSLFLLAVTGMYTVIVYWSLLAGAAIAYRRIKLRTTTWNGPVGVPDRMERPRVSVLVPAHNEARVIARTVRSLAAMDYADFEILVIDDGSTDGTGAILADLKPQIPRLRVLSVPPGEGGRGKPAALNLGLREASGEVFAIYDADNTPEPDSLPRLVACLLRDPRIAAVNGSVRTRNRDETWLTRFIAVEFILFQWLFQAGRWVCFRQCSLMGTNYLVRRSVIDEVGPFALGVLSEDLELSARILEAGHRIFWDCDAVTWEQEPATLPSWFRQRTRWARGGLQVVGRIVAALPRRPARLGLELFHIGLGFGIFLPSVLVSHGFTVAAWSGNFPADLPASWTTLWQVAALFYFIQCGIAVTLQRSRLFDYLLGMASWLVYAPLYVPVALMALGQAARDLVGRRRVEWTKTPRSLEL